ncbi:ribulokinase [Pedobacter sp. MC2016-14]|uniref:ribulokinase n=1 Tax=Pedobacter sp. MC2016-14 TaxID=2897327 RepID=UPI001E5B5AF8|nr:ribulokinase [Pedobacter sp. MC2016-14]MCD0487954.1 ribulokinase [Pedobacter sp. MC2016-14]
MNTDQFVIGVDYGSDSVRSVLVNAKNGVEIASSVFNYPRWQQGLYCNPATNQFRQHPLDYIEGLTHTIKDCLQQAGTEAAAAVKAISIDTTGSTPVAVNEAGVPLALLPEFEENPHAMFVLWKDHTAVKEAAQINAHALTTPVNYLDYCGGIYSSEWFWAKLLRTLRTDEAVKNACYSWVEHCDWIPFLLTGGSAAKEMKRSRCAAGHKALWAEEFDGLPPNEFFKTLDPILDGFTDRLFSETYTSDESAGSLSAEWAEKLGLSTDVKVGVGAFDAHMGAVGGQIEPYHLSKVMGTSTCDILVAPATDMEGKLIKGICGQVNGSVIPGMLGLEAGQSAFGDVYAWVSKLTGRSIPELAEAAAKLPNKPSDPIGIDWLNGRRTPDANQMLGAAVMNLTLATGPAELFKAMAEATCFGAKNIVERFIAEGVPVKGIIGIGGVAKKSPYIMQMMADVLNMPIRIHKFEHTCALGAAMFAAVVAGIYGTTEEAMQGMGCGFEQEFYPIEENVAFYAERFPRYKSLGNYIEKNTIHE